MTLRTAPLVDVFGRAATYGARQWFGRVGNRWGGITLLGKGEGGGVLKAYYATGREIPEFDSTGARNWKYHTSDDGVASGPPEMITGLSSFRPKGRSWVEWLLPAELSEGEDEPEDFLWILNGLKVHDYTFSGGLLVQGSKIVTANNALVALFIATQRMGLPLSRFHKWGQSWIDFKAACDAQVAYLAGTGLKGEYYADATLTSLVHTRNEPYLDRDWDYVSPAPDVPAAPFSARFTGKVKPTHTGTWTFYARYDDGCRVWVNGVQLVNDWTAGAMRESSGTIALTANTEYDIVVEYFQSVTLGGLHLSWSHASVPKEIVPQSRLISPSRTVERYSAHVAFPAGTPALAAFNSVFRRAPGCTWQDVNGAIRVISTADRPVTHKFTYDLTQDVLPPNIIDGSFSLKPRSREDRPDYLIIAYDDVDDPFFTTRTVPADRRVDDTKPPLNPLGPIPIGVASRSLASRIAETEMNVVHSLSYNVRLAGFADSHKVAKGDVVELSHEVPAIRETAPLELFITEEKFLATKSTADDRAFVARLHDPNWYSDAGYVPMEARIVSDLRSPYVPPPPVTSVALVQFDRFLPDDTHVPVVQGLAQFAEHPYPQRGRVYWKRPRRAFTFNASTDTFTATGHGMPNGTKVELFNSGGALPAGFAVSTAYYVVGAAQNTFQLSLAVGGSAVNGTSAGSGTNEVREYDFAPTGILITPDPTTLKGAFEVENTPLGANDFKVVTESLKGVSRGVASATAYAFIVTALPLPPDVTGVTLALKNKALVATCDALSATLYPDLVAYVWHDETGAEVGRTRDSKFIDFNLPAGLPQVNTYTAQRKVKVLLRGNRLSANFATAWLDLKKPATPSLTVTMPQPQSIRLNVSRAGADPREAILETVIEVIEGVTTIDTITRDGDVRQYDFTANPSVHPQLKFRVFYRHVAAKVADGDKATTGIITFTALGPADLPTATASAKGAVQTTTATATAVSTDDPRLPASSVAGLSFPPNVGVGVAPNSPMHVAGRLQVSSLDTTPQSYATRAESIRFTRSDLPNSYISGIFNSWSGTVGNNTMTFGVTDHLGTTTPVMVLVGNGSVRLNDASSVPAAVTNGVSLWSESVGGNSELKVLDELGNTTTLSPHAKDAPAWLYDADDPQPPRVSREANLFSGTIRFTNHTRASRLLQMLLDGEDLSALPAEARRITATETFAEYNERLGLAEGGAGYLRARGWDETQEALRAEREVEQGAWLRRRDRYEAVRAVVNARNAVEREALRAWMALPIHLKAETPQPPLPGRDLPPFNELRPAAYAVKPRPLWLKDAN